MQPNCTHVIDWGIVDVLQFVSSRSASGIERFCQKSGWRVSHHTPLKSPGDTWVTTPDMNGDQPGGNVQVRVLVCQDSCFLFFCLFWIPGLPRSPVGKALFPLWGFSQGDRRSCVASLAARFLEVCRCLLKRGVWGIACEGRVCVSLSLVFLPLLFSPFPYAPAEEAHGKEEERGRRKKEALPSWSINSRLFVYQPPTATTADGGPRSCPFALGTTTTIALSLLSCLL